MFLRDLFFGLKIWQHSAGKVKPTCGEYWLFFIGLYLSSVYLTKRMYDAADTF